MKGKLGSTSLAKISLLLFKLVREACPLKELRRTQFIVCALPQYTCRNLGH